MKQYKIEDELEEWAKFSLFGHPYDVSIRNKEAILRYLLLSLSKGRVPKKQVVEDVLQVRKEVPPCGWLNCYIHFEHVH